MPDTPPSSAPAASGRTRGVPLTLLLLVLTIAQGVGTGLLVALLTDAGSGDDTLPLSAALVLALVVLVALGGVWIWRRWGVYLLAVSAVVGLVVDAVAGLPPATLVVRVALLGATFALIRRRFDSFE